MSVELDNVPRAVKFCAVCKERLNVNKDQFCYIGISPNANVRNENCFVGFIYFHVKCFENAAGEDYLNQLINAWKEQNNKESSYDWYKWE
jgi:hypothetical protein